MPLIRRGLAQAYLDAGDLEEAEAAARHSLLIDGDSSPSWVLLGSVLAHSMRQERRSMPTPKRSTSIRPSFAWNFRGATC